MTNEEMKEDANFFYSTPRAVLEYMETHKTNQTSYVGWYQVRGNVLRVFAYRWKKMKDLLFREVIRKSPDGEGLVYRDMYLTCMSGWKVVFERQAKKSYNWYGSCYYDISEEDFGKWYWYPQIGIWYPVINAEVLQETEYKYCGWSKSLGMELVDYLRLYKENPQVEYFGKMGLVPKKSLLNKAKKDKQFAHYLWEHRDTNWEYYLPTDILYAYKNHCSFDEAQQILIVQRDAERFCRRFTAIKGMKLDKVRIYEYCEENDIRESYGDYLRALIDLGYDLNDTKNLFPKNFRRMHDMRIREWDSEKAKKEKKAREKFNRQFKKAAEKYRRFELEDGTLCIVIPKNVNDLKKEGDKLDHCVGKMGYDQKMIDGESFIAFVRNVDTPKEPYVTVEYGIKEKQILQIYGIHDSKPKKEVIAWAKKWEKMVKNELKKEKVV